MRQNIQMELALNKRCNQPGMRLSDNGVRDPVNFASPLMSPLLPPSYCTNSFATLEKRCNRIRGVAQPYYRIPHAEAPFSGMHLVALVGLCNSEHMASLPRDQVLLSNQSYFSS